ncbi:hypothetical protein AV926_04950 [Myroides marinus]|uniref:Uncharacterized protein n=1 Tax=Myroides marinus TaxID=703342 RepID=A0A164A2Z3_9FLAO|nr:hypothetical protein [Myroides marinus]KZE82900.1 hypothetical protein AV926_04950 [Myroides marinus]
MKVKMQEVRTVLEGTLTSGGSLTLEYAQQDNKNPEHISINAQKDETFISGGMYVPNESFNLSINGYTADVGGMVDEIYKQCKAVLVVEPEVKVGK